MTMKRPEVRKRTNWGFGYARAGDVYQHFSKNKEPSSKWRNRAITAVRQFNQTRTKNGEPRIRCRTSLLKMDKPKGTYQWRAFLLVEADVFGGEKVLPDLEHDLLDPDYNP